MSLFVFIYTLFWSGLESKQEKEERKKKIKRKVIDIIKKRKSIGKK